MRGFQASKNRRRSPLAAIPGHSRNHRGHVRSRPRRIFRDVRKNGRWRSSGNTLHASTYAKGRRLSAERLFQMLPGADRRGRQRHRQRHRWRRTLGVLLVAANRATSSCPACPTPESLTRHVVEHPRPTPRQRTTAIRDWSPAEESLRSVSGAAACWPSDEKRPTPLPASRRPWHCPAHPATRRDR